MTRTNSWIICATVVAALAGFVACGSAGAGPNSSSDKPVLTLKGAAR